MLRYFSGLIFIATVFSASAQSYPAKPVRIIVPSAPGGGYDFIGRLAAEKFSQEFGQGFVVENRVGAGTLVGTQAAAAAPADGYTLLVGGLANMAFNPGLHRDLRYDPAADFTPIAMVGAFTYALVGRKDLAPSTLRQLIDYARANPGKLTIATSGIGTGQHVSAVLLKRLANIDLLQIAYKGAQPAYIDLLAGRVDLFFDNTTTARPFITDGRVKPFVTSGSVRDALLPNVPTGREAGLEELVLDSWLGLFAQSKTPRAIIHTLRAATLKMLEIPDTRKRLETNGWRIISMSSAETEAFVKSEAEKWPRLLQQAGIKAE
jgi:tripartite-type tricarboxylate transporter receptor subunit TctC